MNDKKIPKSPKELKFFGAVSVDDYKKPTVNNTTVDTVPKPASPSFLSKCSPKFMRSKSFVIPSPKLARKFFQSNNNEHSMSPTKVTNDNGGGTDKKYQSSFQRNSFTKSLKNFVRQKSQKQQHTHQRERDDVKPPPEKSMLMETNLNSSTTSNSSSVATFISKSDVIDENSEYIVNNKCELKIGENFERTKKLDHWRKLDIQNRR